VPLPKPAPVPKPVPLSKDAPVHPKPVPLPKPARPKVVPLPKPARPKPVPLPQSAPTNSTKPANTPVRPKPVLPVAAPSQRALTEPFNCSATGDYSPPSDCGSNYSDINILINDINSNLQIDGSIFSATLNPGAYIWPVTSVVSTTASFTSLKLCCGGNAGSCIIDGQSPSSKRTVPLFYFFYSQLTSLTIQGIKFQNVTCKQQSLSCDGAVLSTGNRALVTLKHITAASCKAKAGFGNIGQYSTAIVEESEFSFNEAYTAGGVFFVDDSSRIFLYRNTFFNNKALNGGGALYQDSSSLEAKCNTFYLNTASFGGAIFLKYSHSKLSNNTFTSNTALLQGGAVLAINNPLDSVKNNFTNNTASMGGAYIISYGAAYINGDVFIENKARPNGPNLFLEHATMSHCDAPTLFPGVFIRPPFHPSIVQPLCLHEFTTPM
jgi:hypothetical protein